MAAPWVVVYVHRNAAQLAVRYRTERIHRIENLELYALESDWVTQVATQLVGRMSMSLTVAAEHLYLLVAGETSSSVVERASVVPQTL